MREHSKRIAATLVTVLAAANLGGVLGGSPALAAAEGCPAGTQTDYNGDDFSDAVVADPTATVDGEVAAGRVLVQYGDDARVGEGGRGEIRQGADSLTESPEPGDRFGSAIASADIDCDGFTDLVVGTPYEDVGMANDSGLVQVVWGSAAGLGMGDADASYTQVDFGGVPTSGDQFGWAVDAFEDAGQGGTPAPDAYVIGIGAPGTDIDGASNAGWVGFLAATDGGNVAMGASQNTPGVPDVAEPGDRFGSVITLNYMTGGDPVDAAIGVPKEDVGAKVNAGVVIVLTDVYDAITAGSRVTQGTPGVDTKIKKRDRFGASLDSVTVGGKTRLAVGVPGEDTGAKNSGLVQLFKSDQASLTPAKSITQDTPRVKDKSETKDRFGEVVAFAPKGPGNSKLRLAVSAPYENVKKKNDGKVWVFPLNNLKADKTYTQATPGIAGVPQAQDRFGLLLAVVNGFGETALLIGVPDDATRTTGMVNVVPLAGAGKRFWAPGVGGVTAVGDSRFGGALASSSDS